MTMCDPDSGLTKQDYYRQAKHQVNADHDQQLKNKSWFTSKSSIESSRKQALKQVNEDYWGGRGYGGFCE